MSLGKAIIDGVGGIKQNLDDSRSNASTTSSVAHAREDSSIRVAAEAKNVTRIEAGIGILPREMGIR